VLERKIEALSLAMDEAGNRLAHAIAEYRDEWLATVDEVAHSAAGRYADAVAAAQANLRRRLTLALVMRLTSSGLRVAPSSGWSASTTARRSSGVSSSSAVDGSWSKGTTTGPLRGEVDPAELLRVAAKAAVPATPPQPRSSREAGVTR
jgi:hypothetical protein